MKIDLEVIPLDTKKIYGGSIQSNGKVYEFEITLSEMFGAEEVHFFDQIDEDLEIAFRSGIFKIVNEWD